MPIIPIAAAKKGQLKIDGSNISSNLPLLMQKLFDGTKG
jgi:hypothetical protein